MPRTDSRVISRITISLPPLRGEYRRRCCEYQYCWRDYQSPGDSIALNVYLCLEEVQGLRCNMLHDFDMVHDVADAKDSMNKLEAELNLTATYGSISLSKRGWSDTVKVIINYCGDLMQELLLEGTRQLWRRVRGYADAGLRRQREREAALMRDPLMRTRKYLGTNPLTCDGLVHSFEAGLEACIAELHFEPPRTASAFDDVSATAMPPIRQNVGRHDVRALLAASYRTASAAPPARGRPLRGFATPGSTGLEARRWTRRRDTSAPTTPAASGTGAAIGTGTGTRRWTGGAAHAKPPPPLRWGMPHGKVSQVPSEPTRPGPRPQVHVDAHIGSWARESEGRAGLPRELDVDAAAPQRWPVSLHGVASPWPSALDMPDDSALPSRVLRALSPALAYADSQADVPRPHTTGSGMRVAARADGPVWDGRAVHRQLTSLR